MNKIATLAYILYFGLVGLSYFWHIKWAPIVIAISALVIAVILVSDVLKKK